jgi:PE-PPE domain/PE family
MNHVFVQPQLLATTAADVAGIGSVIDRATAAATGPTSGLAAAAGDEVSVATAELFNAYSQGYRAILRQAANFHDEFARALTGAGGAYARAEADAAGALASLTAPASAGSSTSAVGKAIAAATQPVSGILVLGASGTPIPSATYIQEVVSGFLPNLTLPAGVNPIGVATPEGLYPFTGVKDLTLDISLARGVIQLNNAITQAIAPGATGNPLAVLAYSQSAIIASLEMPKLLAQGYSPSQLIFTLLGDPSAPNGGLLARFPGLDFPSLGLTAGISTPSNAFPTTIYTLEYDGFADFPRYPLDIFSDLNALAGILTVHEMYPTLTAAQIASGILLPGSQLLGTPNSMTNYYLIPTHDLPLLDPLRMIPGIGNPLADLLQPDLTYLVNWGYGDPAYGYSTSPANVVTPFGFLPPLHATTALLPDLINGIPQGLHAAVADLHAEMPTSLPSLSGLANSITGALSSPGGTNLPALPSFPTSITGVLSGIESANDGIAGGLAGAVSTAYSTLLPTADLATAVAVSVPSYDVNLFLNGITQAVNGQPIQGLINAIGDPIAADVGLLSIGAGFEGISILNSLQTILTGVPNPGVDPPI